MSKVTNKHDAPLNIAGVDIRPGATAEVPEKVLKVWINGHAAKQWIEMGLVETDAKLDVAPAKTKTDKTKKADPSTPVNEARVALEGKAAGLGIEFTAETTDEDLTNAVAEAEQEAAGTERENLLKEARDLGLNPNANTGLEKLKTMVAEKKAAN